MLANSSNAQVCPTNANPDEGYKWPTHSKWFYGMGSILDFGTSGSGAGTRTAFTGPEWYNSYESVASAADENGNIVIATNGVKLWDSNGAEVAIPGGRLLTGNETANGDAGSAVHGVMIVKHPLDTANYYIFTTDDAISGQQAAPITYGFNYCVYNRVSNSITVAPTRLGAYRSTEQIAATWHSNKVDVWIVTHESLPTGSASPAFTTDYHAYLLECSGLVTAPVTSSLGFKVTAGLDWQNKPDRSNERASLKFSWDGTKAAATHHRGNGFISDITECVGIMDFDGLTGQLSNWTGINANDVPHSNPYNCEFSPSSNRLFVSFQSDPWSATTSNGRIEYYPVVGGGAPTLVGGISTTVDVGFLKLGGDGVLYGANFILTPWGRRDALVTVGNPDGAPTWTEAGVASGAAGVAYGLPSMFLPPRDWLKIDPPPALDHCTTHNFETNWICKKAANGIDSLTAENTPRYENAYKILTQPGGATINTITGAFTSTQAGNYSVEFKICNIADTVDFIIASCSCDADVKDGPYEICAGDNMMLDSLLNSASGPGTWDIDSVPASVPGTNLASIDHGATDTLFNTTVSTRPGTYKIMFTVTGETCKDSTYITVNPIPVPAIGTVGPLCKDAAAVVMTGTPQNGADTTGTWLIDNVANATGTFDPATLAKGYHTVRYTATVKGCTAFIDSSFLVNELPVVDVNDSTICFGGASALFSATADSAATGWLWSENATGTSAAATGTVTGNHTVVLTDENGCTGTHIGILTITPLPVPSITAIADLCANSAAVAIVGAPTGVGVTSSFKVNDTLNVAGTFDPVLFREGVNVVRYITTVNNCTDSTDINVTVLPLKDATLGDSVLVKCIFDRYPRVFVNQTGGTWNNAAVSMNGDSAIIDLAALVAAGVSLDANGDVDKLVITYTQLAPCGDVDQIVVSTTSALDATITPPAQYCDDDTVRVTLVGKDPGGTWHGTGIVDAATGKFRPSDAGQGTHAIEYRIGGACGDTAAVNIIVDPRADATITTANDTLCITEVAFPIASTVAGGTWTELAGTNTNGGFNPATGIFTPATSGAGTYNLQYAFAGNCPHMDTINITIEDTAIINITAQAPLCAGAAAVTMAATPAAGNWTASGTGLSVSTFTPTVANVGVNTLTYTTTDNCPVFKTTEVIVVPVLNADLPDNREICLSEPPFDIVPTNGLGGTFASATCPTCIDAVSGRFNPLTVGAHTVTYNYPDPANAGCNIPGSMIVTVQEPIVPAFGPLPSEFEGHTGISIITATPVSDPSTGSVGAWEPGPNVNAAGEFDHTGKVFVNNPYTATYKFTTSAGCSATAIVSIDVLPAPPVAFERTSVDGCIPVNETFNDLTDYTDVTLATSVWGLGNGTSTELLTTSTDYTSAGSYTVSLTNTYTNGCIRTHPEPDFVTAYAFPQAEFSWAPNPVTVLNPNAQFANLSNGADMYLWDFDNKANLATSSLENPAVVFTSQTDDTVNVELIVISINGCPDTVVHPVIIQDIFTLYVPNAFTPSTKPDGLNDTFFPQGTNWDTDGYEFVVLDRWGNLIFESSVIGQGWNGAVNGASGLGNLSQIDVYVWKVTVKNRYTGKKHKKVGTVTLVR